MALVSHWAVGWWPEGRCSKGGQCEPALLEVAPVRSPALEFHCQRGPGCVDISSCGKAGKLCVQNSPQRVTGVCHCLSSLKEVLGAFLS